MRGFKDLQRPLCVRKASVCVLKDARRCRGYAEPDDGQVGAYSIPLLRERDCLSQKIGMLSSDGRSTSCRRLVRHGCGSEAVRPLRCCTPLEAVSGPQSCVLFPNGPHDIACDGAIAYSLLPTRLLQGRHSVFE